MRIILADDDLLILQGLRSHIEKIGYQVIAQARDGQQALELVKELKPDLLISDVKMPLLDGMGLIKKLRAENYQIPILMLSGYDDYNYLRESMRCNAVDYLLKPINFAEFDAILQDCQRKQTIAKQERANEEQRRNAQRNDMLFADYVANKGATPLPAGFTGCAQYAVAMFSLDECVYENSLNTESSGLQNVFTQEMLREFFQENRSMKITSCMYKEYLVILIGADAEKLDFEAELNEDCGELRNLSERYTRLSVSGALRGPFSDLNECAKHINTCRQALHIRFYASQGCMVDERILVPAEQDLPQEKLNQIMEEISGQVLFAELPLMRRSLEQLFRTIEFYHLSENKTRRILFDVLNAVGIVYEDFKRLSESDPDEEDVLTQCILKNRRFIPLRKSFIQLFLTRIVICRNTNDAGNGQLVEAAKQYVREHYKEQISLKEVADNIHLNYTYLSGLFKMKTGMSFSAYLTKIRIDEAKKLLRIPEVKVYEISEMVGYMAPASFARVFKKSTGLTPAEYRNVLK